MRKTMLYTAALAVALTGCSPPSEEPVAASEPGMPTVLGYLFNPSNGDVIHLNNHPCYDTVLSDLGYTDRFVTKDRHGGIYFGCYRVEDGAITIRYDKDEKAPRRLPLTSLVLSEEYKEYLALRAMELQELPK